MSSIDFPFRFESKTVLRYFLPGILSFALFLPYIRDVIPFWKSLTEVGQIGFGLFYSLSVGLIIEIIIDSYARCIFMLLMEQHLFTEIFHLKDAESVLADFKSPTISVLPPDLQLGITMENREVIWHTTAVAHMLVGCAIVFSSYSILSLLSLSLANPIQVLFTLFSIFMSYTCLRGGMKQAILRFRYIQTLLGRKRWSKRSKTRAQA